MRRSLVLLLSAATLMFLNISVTARAQSNPPPPNYKSSPPPCQAVTPSPVRAITEILRNIKVAAESKRTRDRRISKHPQSREEYDSEVSGGGLRVLESRGEQPRSKQNCPRAPSKSAGCERIVDRDDVAVTRHGQCFEAESWGTRFQASAGSGP